MRIIVDGTAYEVDAIEDKRKGVRLDCLPDTADGLSESLRRRVEDAIRKRMREAS